MNQSHPQQHSSLPHHHEHQRIKWPKELVPTLIILFGLCAQITFSIIPNLEEEKVLSSGRNISKIRTLLSLAWLFLATSCGLGCALALCQHNRTDGIFEHKPHQYKITQITLCTSIQITGFIGLLFISLVMLEYTAPVGWVAVGLICLAAGGASVCFIMC